MQLFPLLNHISSEFLGACHLSQGDLFTITSPLIGCYSVYSLLISQNLE